MPYMEHMGYIYLHVVHWYGICRINIPYIEHMGIGCELCVFFFDAKKLDIHQQDHGVSTIYNTCAKKMMHLT